MPENCENCKANPVDIARKTTGTPTAKLIAILQAQGITSAAEIAEIIGITERAVRKARNSGAGTQVPSGTTGPEPQDRSGTQVPKTELQDRNCGSGLARANIESLRDKSILEVNKIPLTPKPTSEVVERVRFAQGRLELCDELFLFWLEQFGGDKVRLLLALVEVGGRIQPNSSRPLEAQVSSQLARIAGDKRDRDSRYEAAVKTNAKPTARPAPVAGGLAAALAAKYGSEVHA